MCLNYPHQKILWDFYCAFISHGEYLNDGLHKERTGGCGTKARERCNIAQNEIDTQLQAMVE